MATRPSNDAVREPTGAKLCLRGKGHVQERLEIECQIHQRRVDKNTINYLVVSCLFTLHHPWIVALCPFTSCNLNLLMHRACVVVTKGRGSSDDSLSTGAGRPPQPHVVKSGSIWRHERYEGEIENRGM